METVRLHTGEVVTCTKLAKMSWPSAGQEVDRRTKKLMAETGRGYSDAMRVVLDADRNLKETYAREGLVRRKNLSADFRERLGPNLAPPSPQTATAGFKVHEKIVARRRANPSESYAQAMDEILRLDPELKAEFARCA
jgi:hypothetical protein